MIQNTPENERPRERLLSQGAECLSLRECLAVLLGSGPKGEGCLGLAQHILNRPGTGLSVQEQEHAFFLLLENPHLHSLKEIRGLGEAGLSRILAAFEIARRYLRYRRSNLERERPRFHTLIEKALERISSDQRQSATEWFSFVPVYPNGKLGDLCLVQKGKRSEVHLDPVDLFSQILALRPRALILCHNHPSGNLEPSSADRVLTQKIGRLCLEFGMDLLGHWIIGPEGERWLSFFPESD